jgi:hypothetical protein
MVLPLQFLIVVPNSQIWKSSQEKYALLTLLRYLFPVLKSSLKKEGVFCFDDNSTAYKFSLLVKKNSIDQKKFLLLNTTNSISISQKF